MIDRCRSCYNSNLVEVLSLGDQYLSDFREDDIKPPKYPLTLMFCPKCYLVQLKESTPQTEMYTPRYGFKSGVNNTIKADLLDIVDEALRHVPDPKNWLDIASNDGTLLKFVPNSITKVGIDPIEKLCLEAEEHADRIINDYFDIKHFPKKVKFDVITSISCFYDMPDPNKFVAEVGMLLAQDGIWTIQQNYILTTLELNAVDNICHEHLEYYSLLSMEQLLRRYELEIFDVSTSMVNGGCIRTLVCHKGTRKIQPSVKYQRDKELAKGLDKYFIYEDFGIRAVIKAAKLHDLVKEIVDKGQKVYIYGASTRGGTIWQLANLDVALLEKAVERNPDKFGKIIASIGVPIISEEQARKEKPEYMLVSPWFFKEEFIEREKEYLANGGKFIFPLPEVEVI